MTEEQLEKLWIQMVKEHEKRLGDGDEEYLEIAEGYGADAWDVWNNCEETVTEIEELAEAEMSKPDSKSTVYRYEDENRVGEDGDCKGCDRCVGDE